MGNRNKVCSKNVKNQSPNPSNDNSSNNHNSSSNINRNKKKSNNNRHNSSSNCSTTIITRESPWMRNSRQKEQEPDTMASQLQSNLFVFLFLGFFWFDFPWGSFIETDPSHFLLPTFTLYLFIYFCFNHPCFLVYRG
uniref:Uncharacterized protein n=1 Tax=Opuntia streptacantha TaxID=393608 RepID=A0A7C9D7J8_OPUST